MNVTAFAGFMAAVALFVLIAQTYSGVQAQKRGDEKAEKKHAQSFRFWFAVFVFFGALCASTLGRG